ALSMLYWGEGAKSRSTSMGSSDPKILRFFVTVLRQNYGISDEMLRCDLHLRMDQDEGKLKTYWSKHLNIPIERFKYVSFDKRTAGKPTYEGYHGVCLIRCADISVRRKLIYMYSLFYDKIFGLDDQGT